MAYTPAQRIEQFAALERGQPLLHSMHMGLALAWLFFAAVARAPEGVVYALLVGIVLVRFIAAPRRMLELYGRFVLGVMGGAYLMWVAYDAVSVLWSPDPVWATGQPMAIRALPIRPVIGAFLIWPLVPRWRFLLGAFALGGAVSALVTVPGALVLGQGMKQRDPLLLIGHLPSAGLAMLAACIVAFAAFAQAHGWRAVLLGAATALVSAGGVALVAARTLVAAGTAGALTVLLRPARERPRGATARGVGGLALAMLVVAFFFGGQLMDRTEILMSGEGTVSDGSSSIEVALKRHMGSRGPMWLAAVDLWQQKPIFGHGFYSWREVGGQALETNPDRYGARPYLNSEISKLNQPHNAYLETLFSGGVVGLAFFMWMLWQVARGLWKRTSVDWWGSAALGIFAAWAVAGIGGAVENITMGAIVLMLMVVVAASPD